MNYSGIITDDIANGIGIRTSLFVSGCRNNCPGCFNKEQQNFNYGELFTEDTIKYIIDSVNDNYHDGITILGGDPMEPENATEVLKLVNIFRDKFGYSKNIWIYTGYLFENIDKFNDDRRKLMYSADILVDGPFIQYLKDIRLKFRGSSNQRIINIKATINNNNTPVIIE